MIQLATGTAGLIILYFGMLFALACQQRDFSIADIGWGFGFIIVALYCKFTSTNDSLLTWLVVGLVSVWGLRLSSHIYLRNKNKAEDFRYKKLRDKWQRFVNVQAFLKLYVPQIISMWLIAIPIMIACNTLVHQIGIVSWLFAVVALFGLSYEALGDYQLAQFKKLPESRGKIMQTGLWRYSRHPNYFGEIVFWWGISLLVATSTGNFYALISGAVINVLLVFISGVPMLEEKYKDNPEFQAYAAKTNAVVPGWSRSA